MAKYFPDKIKLTQKHISSRNQSLHDDRSSTTMRSYRSIPSPVKSDDVFKDQYERDLKLLKDKYEINLKSQELTFSRELRVLTSQYEGNMKVLKDQYERDLKKQEKTYSMDLRNKEREIAEIKSQNMNMQPNLKSREKEKEIEVLKYRLQDAERKIQNCVNELKKRDTENERYIEDYENELKKRDTENESLKNNIEGRHDVLDEVLEKNQKLTQEIKQLRLTNENIEKENSEVKNNFIQLTNSYKNNTEGLVNKCSILEKKVTHLQRNNEQLCQDMENIKHQDSQILNYAKRDMKEMTKENEKLKVELETIQKSKLRTNDTIMQRDEQYQDKYSQPKYLLRLNRRDEKIKALQKENNNLQETVDQLKYVTSFPINQNSIETGHSTYQGKEDKDVNRLLSEIETLKSSLDSKNEELKDSKDSADSLTKELRKIKSVMEHDKKKIKKFEEIQTKVNSLKEEKKQLLKENEELSRTADIHQNCFANNCEESIYNTEIYKKKADDMENEITILREKVECLERSISQSDDVINNKAKINDVYKQKNEFYEKQISELNINLNSKEERVSNLKNQISELNRTIEDKAKINDVLKQEIEFYEKQISELNINLNSKEERVSNLNNQISELNRTIKDTTQTNNRLLESAENYKHKIDGLEIRLNDASIKDITNEYESLKETQTISFRSNNFDSLQSSDNRHTFFSMKNDSDMNTLSIEQENSNLRKQNTKIKILLEDKEQTLKEITNERDLLLATIQDEKYIRNMEEMEDIVETDGATSMNYDKLEDLEYENVRDKETIEDINKKYKKLLASCDNDKKNIANLENELSSVKDEAYKYKTKAVKSNQEAQELFDKNKKLSNTIEDKQNEIANLVEVSKIKENVIYDLELKIKNIQSEVIGYQTKLTEVYDEGKEMRDENITLKNRIEENNKEKTKMLFDATNLKNRITTLNGEISDFENKVSMDTATITKLKNTIETLQTSISDLNFQNEDLLNDNRDLHYSLEQLSRQSNPTDFRGANRDGASHSLSRTVTPGSLGLEREIKTLRLEIESMKELLESKDDQLSDLRSENNELKKNFENFKSQSRSRELPVYDSSTAYSGLRNNTGLSPQHAEPGGSDLRLEIEKLNDELKKKQSAITIMKEKLKAQYNEVSIGTVNELRRQNTAFSMKLDDCAAELENLRIINKELTDQAALLRNEKHTILTEMENMKKLNFSRNVARPITDQEEINAPVASAQGRPQFDIRQKVPPWWVRHMIHKN